MAPATKTLAPKTRGKKTTMEGGRVSPNVGCARAYANNGEILENWELGAAEKAYIASIAKRATHWGQKPKSVRIFMPEMIK